MMNLPHLLRIRQRFDATAIAAVDDAVAHTTDQLDVWGKVKAGQTVAVGCSSRGIGRYDEIVAATVRALQARGLKPFLFPAMGSHGAATAQGQLRVLADAGIDEASMGVPVRSSLDVVRIGATANGLDVLVDEHAWQADHLVLVNRIKPHTEFEHEFESGLQKMLAIGIGKQQGATLYHQAFMLEGYPAILRAVADVVLQSEKFLFGVGVVENAFGRPARIQALAASDLYRGESELLEQAKQHTPRLPFDDGGCARDR